ncbi:methyltransferase [Rhodococcus sp. H29-C3]|uniref:methyltransferase n=1 Tax=Rhodococcus sp. H29-C3 TaxID=3046307 RepID=UPI0024B8E3B0|nr:methyltransferase [Rhodococcus sp. H29-C3]MDJ0362334.1 methyltransferase [Rhodococcus sp. H29-C3]
MPASKYERLPASLQVLQAVTASWSSGVITTFAELGFADVLHERPMSAVDLARRMATDEEATRRLCRTAGHLGLLSVDDQQLLHLEPMGDALRSDSPESMRNFARWTGSWADRATWCHLPTAVRTGRSPFSAQHGSSVWEYFAAEPAAAAVFDAAMSETSRHVIRPVVDCFDFSQYLSIVDVGGGRGALLSAALEQAPGACGILFDQDEVINRAHSALKGHPAADRIRTVKGSFFESVPTGGDLYVVSNIIHDWDDEQAGRILLVIAEAMSTGAELALVEAVAGVDEKFDNMIGLMDMDMLLLCNGKQRTVDEFKGLLDAVGIELITVHRAGLQSIVHGRKI